MVCPVLSILSLENVTRQYRSDPVLDQLTLGIDPGERIGVIGANGSGKSTLLRILAGVEPVDSGRVTVASGARVAFLSQHPQLDENLSVLDAIFSASGDTMRLIAEYERACQDLSAGAAGQEQVSALAARLEAAGAWDLETRARTVLSHLGIRDVRQRVGELSGGQRKRVALAHALLDPADVLLLDEPTNHLDVAAIAWLERYIVRFSGALVLVTHDRYFLDRVGTRMVELERGRLRSYTGNYAAYLEAKEVERELDAATREKQANLMRQELAWLRRGARARATKQKARVERAQALLATPTEVRPSELDIALTGRRLGTKGVELVKVSKSYGTHTVVGEATFTLQKGDRVGIVGPNGCGKTTLLDIIAGRTPPTRGTVEHGPTVAVGYYDQMSRELPENQRVIDYIHDTARVIETSDGSVITASQMLERFLFSGAIQYAPVGRLSGGERRRLYLLKVLMENPNVLLLDEPTNDLDIPTLMRLEGYLDTFGGILVVVSHDRYFLDRTVDTVLYFDKDHRVTEFAGNASAWLDQQPVELVSDAPPAAAGAPKAVRVKERRLTFNEKHEMAKLEKDIEQGESRQQEIEAALATSSSDYDSTVKLYRELEQLKVDLERWTARWTELADLPG